jgi:hypothetical protein
MDMQDRKRVDLKFVDPFTETVKEVIDKDNYQGFLTITRNIGDPEQSYAGVKEGSIPVDLGKLADARFMHVNPGTKVPKHAHDGPVFRIITEGEAIVNGKSYNAGDWMVIPKGVAYEVETTKGYTSFWNCGRC